MRRRQFITTLLGGAAAWPLVAHAQQGERVRRIGVLINLAADDPEMVVRLTAFRRALDALGWTEGRNLTIDIRRYAGDPDQIREATVEMVGLAPELILVYGPPGLSALRRQTRTIPIVFTQDRLLKI